MRCKVLSILLITIVLAILLTGCGGLNLNVSSPKDGAVLVRTPQVVVGSTSKSASITVNGEPVQVTQYGTFKTMIALTEGENIITVIATKDDKVKTVVLTVTYKP